MNHKKSQKQKQTNCKLKIIYNEKLDADKCEWLLNCTRRSRHAPANGIAIIVWPFVSVDCFLQETAPYANRWILHNDMVKQYATCVKERMEVFADETNVELYVDAWRSLNDRFQQRCVWRTLYIEELCRIVLYCMLRTFYASLC